MNGLTGRKYLEIGKITSVHGIKGEVRVAPWCDGPEFLVGFGQLYYMEGRDALPVKVEYSRPVKNMVIMKLEGCDSADEALKLRGRILYMDRDDVDLAEGCYFIQDLIGLTVSDYDTKKVYGTLTDVFQTGANDVYTVRSESGEEFLIPAIPDVIMKNDLENGEMLIRPISGLFDK